MYYYLKNVAVGLNEEDRETITYPRVELVTHITTKTLQSGAVLGTLLVGPLLALSRGKRDWATIQRTSYTCGRRGGAIGLGLGIPLYLMGTWNKDYQSIWDMTYRIRFNRNQNRVDRLSIVGMGVGVGVARLVGEELCKGAVFGMVGGFVLGGLVNYVF